MPGISCCSQMVNSAQPSKTQTSDKIEILGFVMEGINIANEWVGAAWADAFTISGLNISPEVRLTLIWGQLKLR